MGGVDIANRYRADFTTLRPKNYHYWKPLFHWLLDIVLANSYLLAKTSHTPRIGESKDYYSYRRHLDLLYKALMRYHEAPEHNQVLRLTSTYCAYCRKNKNWEPKQQGRARAFGTNITNITGSLRGRIRGSRTEWGCAECNISLCKIGDCWRLWHKNLN
jgi:hypothetical protein